MRTQFEQKAETKSRRGDARFSDPGISNCCLKQLHLHKDASKITQKTHHHNSFEFHITEKGCQEYECGNKVYSISSGEFLFVPPFVKHRLLSSTEGTSKFAVSFNSDNLTYLSECVTGSVPPRFFENMQFITSENLNEKFISKKLVENCVFESTVLLLRLIGLREESIEDASEKAAHDFRVETAKTYIKNNIETRLTVKEIAEICYISSKQLTRLFIKHEGKTLAQYIINQKIEHIQDLLSNEDLSLKTISERMSFQNEYYFNSFVKKYLGLPPGAYRKMVK